jgi:hypothetical protein
MNICTAALTALAALLAGCGGNGVDTDKVFRFAAGQFDLAFETMAPGWEVAREKGLVEPRTLNADGTLRMIPPRDWCSGFFPGSMWYMYEYTGDEKWKERAILHSELVRGEQFDTSSHDVGFKMNCSFGNGYRLTDNPEYRDVLVQSARTLTGRFNPTVGSLRSWSWGDDQWSFPVIVDNMMNLELLFEAARMTGDQQMYDIADTHARTTLENHFRGDNSSYHVVDYDPATGEVVKKITHQGYSDESAWARGQAWGLYGFTMTYRYTRNPDYLAQAQRIAGFIFSHPRLPEDLIPYWDYDAPSIPDAPRDASAACITASALYELAGYAPELSGEYVAWADTILQNLTLHYRAAPGTAGGFLLLHSTGHLPGNSEIDVPINYADYYYLEALIRSKTL